MAASKPVLINSNGVIAQDLEKYNCGKLLDPYSIDSSIETILQLKSNPAAVKTMSLNARSTAESHFNRFKMAEKFEAVLLKTIES